MSDQNEQVEEMVEELANPTISEEEEEASKPTGKEQEEEKPSKAKKTEEEEEEPSDEFEEFDNPDENAEVASLRAQVEQLKGLIEKQGKTSEEDEEEIDLGDETFEFVTEEEFEEILDNRDSFNKVLMKVFNQGRMYTLREGGSAIANKVMQNVSVAQRAREFYRDNPELLKHKEYVSKLSNQVSAKYPGKGLDFVFAKTAEIAKAKLKIKDKATETVDKNKNKGKGGSKPAMPRKSGKSTTRGLDFEPEDPEFEKEQKDQMDTMLDSIG